MNIELLYTNDKAVDPPDLDRWVREGGWNLWQTFALCKGAEPQEIAAEAFFDARRATILYPNDTPSYMFDFVAEYDDFATRLIRSPFSRVTPSDLNKYGAHRSSRQLVVFNPENVFVEDPAVFLEWARKNDIGVSAAFAEAVYLVGMGSKGLAERARAKRTADRTRFEEFLISKMRQSPDRNPSNKMELKTIATQDYHLSEKMFEDAWISALQSTGARWNKAGRPKKS